MAKRTEWYHDAALFKGVDFAILHHSSNDEHAGWDYSAIIEALAKIGIPSACVAGDLQTSSGQAQVSASIGRYINT